MGAASSGVAEGSYKGKVAELKEFDEILGNCLEALEGGEALADVLARYPQASEDLRPLLEAAAWFNSQKTAVEPRPGFVRASRARLLANIAAEPVVASSWLARTWVQLASARGGGWRVALQVTLAVLMLACLVLGGSGVALASQGALPGEALYPVKTRLEAVELLVTLDTAAKIQLHNQFSQARLLEIEELVIEGRYNYIRETVSNFEMHVSQASRLLNRLAQRDPEKAAELAMAFKDTLTSQRAFLSFLMAAVPPEVVPEMLRALGIAASGEVAVQAALDAAGSTARLTTTPNSLEAEASATASAEAQLSLQTPTPTLLPSSTLTVTATFTTTATPSSTLPPTVTSTLAPTRTPTAVPRVEEPSPTKTQQPPPQPTDEPEPEKTKKPLPNPTRRPPKP